MTSSGGFFKRRPQESASGFRLNHAKAQAQSFAWFQCANGVNQPHHENKLQDSESSQNFVTPTPPGGSCLQGHICVDTAG